MIWLLLLVGVCAMGGCVMIIGSDDVQIKQQGVDSHIVTEQKKGAPDEAPDNSPGED